MLPVRIVLLACSAEPQSKPAEKLAPAGTPAPIGDPRTQPTATPESIYSESDAARDWWKQQAVLQECFDRVGNLVRSSQDNRYTRADLATISEAMQIQGTNSPKRDAIEQTCKDQGLVH